MRKALNKDEKRSTIIGVKVRNEIKEKIKYLSDIESEPMSTYINKILEENITYKTKLYQINWNEVLQEGRGEK